MNTHRTRLTLLGLALCILLALLIVPQTHWLVRTQILPSSLMPGRYEQQKQAFVRQHPNDYQIQLAGQTDYSHQTQVEYARSLVANFPGNASLRANILRYATANEVHLHRDEDYLLGGQPVPADMAKSKPPSPAQLAAFDADAAAGERLDPDNAYFPFMRAFELFAAHRDAEGLAAVQRASKEHEWRQYFEDEVEGHWRINDGIYGGREAVASMAVSASTLFPEYAKIRAAARVVAYKAILDEQAGHPEAGLAKRQALGRCGELMATQSTVLIGNLVGVAINAISRTRPGGTPPIKYDSRITGDQRVLGNVNRYCDYVTKIGHPEAAAQARADYRAGQQVRSVASEIGDDMSGSGLKDLVRLVFALMSGWVLFFNILSFFVLGIIAVGLSRLPQIQARRPLPVGATVGFWSAILIGLLLAAVFVGAGAGDFATYAVLLVLAPFVCAALLALILPRLRRPIVTGLLAAGVTLGVIGLLGALAAGPAHGGTESIQTFREMLGGDSSNGMPSEQQSEAPVWALLGPVFGLAIPLLLAIVLSIVSRVKRVPVSVGLVGGFRTVMPPLVFGLMLVYGGLVLWTVRQEARVNYGLERSLHGEGQYLAQMTGETWPRG